MDMMLLRQSHRRSRQCFTIVTNRIRDDSSTVFIRSVASGKNSSAARLGQKVVSTTPLRLPIGRQHRISFSSEAAFLSKVPDYLIPPAYRTRNPDDGRGRGGNAESDGSRSGLAKRRSRSSGRPNHSSNKQARKPSKHRRKSSSGNRRSFNRNKPDAQNLDVQQLEKDLTTKINVYNERLGAISFVNFAAYVDKNATEEEAAQISSVMGSFFTPLDDSRTSENVNVADLLATEDLYKEIAADLHKLIIGFTDIAETACNAQISQGRDRNDYDEETESDSSPAMYSHYLDSIMKAERYLEALETLYRNRIDAISKAKAILEREKKAKEESDTKVLGKISSFLGDVFLLNNGSSKVSAFDESWKRADGKIAPPSTIKARGQVRVTLDNIDDVIVSHKNGDFTPKTTFYVEQLILANQLAYCFGVDEKTESVQRSNRLLRRWISINCLTQKKQETSADDVTASTIGEDETEESSYVRELFHTVLRQNSDLWSIDGVNEAEEWIKQMHSLKQSGWIQCAPCVDAYNIVLLGLCNLCKPLSSKHADNENRISKREERSRRNFILEGVERLLTQLTELHDFNIHPNILSLNLALNALAKAGRDGDPNLCKIANRVLLNAIGEESYRGVVGIHEQPDESESIEDSVETPALQSATKLFVKPNMDTYHWLVDIYSKSGDAVYIKLGTSLLKKMIEHRLEEQSRHLFRDGSTASFAPSTGTYNNILRALAKKDIDTASVSDENRIGIRTEVAKEATAFLDSMVRYETSYPTRVTFIFLLQLWRKTGSTEAGEYADEILSRMETVSMYQRELKPFSNGYLLALECWHTAATAGYVGAAERAFQLVQIIEGKSGQELISDDQEDTEDDNEGTSPNKRIYPLMMKICAAAQDKRDTPRSMAIAFDVLKKMEDNEMTPGHNIFTMLFESVQNFLKHHPGEEENDLLQKVFVSASRYGVKAPELKNRAERNRM
ncbi:hypothetical protein ACHAXM_011811 [Skeletonema potamos]